MGSDMEYKYFLVQIQAPKEDVPALIAELQKQDVIHISVAEVTNYYKLMKDDIIPFKAKAEIGEFVKKEEVKIEVKALATKIGFVLHAIASVHSYDKPTINVIPLI
nr:hypothetical protein [uncultured Butyrivibrio sp.]